MRFVERFVTDAELPAYFRRADVVALPYRSIDQSGVLYTALAFGKAMVLSDVGGFGELARDHGAAKLVPAGRPGALRAALAGPDRRSGGARASWRRSGGRCGRALLLASIAAPTLELYAS